MNNQIIVKSIKISIIKVNNMDYISLTDLAIYQNSKDPSFTIKNWLRKISTIEYIGLWEQFNNDNFNLVEFDQIKKECGRNSFSMSPSQWIRRTNSIGLISKRGRYSYGTFAHSLIAFEFASWLSPEFKLYLINEFERLKKLEAKSIQIEWDIGRELSKINYLIHTSAIEEIIVPTLTEKQKKSVYREEADLLNVALFGMTKEEWENKNPTLARKGNIRDYADLIQLLILSNLESINASMIRLGLGQQERLIKLNLSAQKQIKLFKNNQFLKQLNDFSNKTG